MMTFQPNAALTYVRNSWGNAASTSRFRRSLAHGSTLSCSRRRKTISEHAIAPSSDGGSKWVEKRPVKVFTGHTANTRRLLLVHDPSDQNSGNV
ncbi:hypothetical protein QQ994_10240 [Pseudomonas asiatica]|uniref:hypothetical protein n=1 Tax=Pseudomonas asiatica TaxID=2219225 RepID=UPI00257043C2|nr:hypothetical protein [Pseudomonas asiatica]WJD72214.1 hypothetical protein QQ994_10240 [Pseudomonas asiatica]